MSLHLYVCWCLCACACIIEAECACVGVRTQHITWLDCIPLPRCDNYQPAGVLNMMCLKYQSQPATPLSVVPSLSVTVEVITMNSSWWSMTRDDQNPGTTFVFHKLPVRGYPRSRISKHAPLSGGGRRCGTARGEETGRGKWLLSRVRWWMVHSVWLRAHMNKHAGLGFCCTHSKCKLLIMWWDEIFDRVSEKSDYSFCSKGIQLWLDCQCDVLKDTVVDQLQTNWTPQVTTLCSLA